MQADAILRVVAGLLGLLLIRDGVAAFRGTTLIVPRPWFPEARFKGRLAGVAVVLAGAFLVWIGLFGL